MMLEAEQLLMVTGLIEAPTRTHVHASRVVLKEQRRDLIAALGREDPGRLYVCPQRPGYFDKLTNRPDYRAYSDTLEPLVGHETADAYVVIHQRARQALQGLRPSSSIDTAMGPMALPLDSISEGRWAIEVDVIEGQRLLKDLAAGALLQEEVTLFLAAFPETYAYLRQELDSELNKKKAAKVSYQPPMWLADALRVFEQKPFNASLELKGPESPQPGPVTGGSNALKKSGFKTDDLKTKGQSVS